jgi:hypothetical protein
MRHLARRTFNALSALALLLCVAAAALWVRSRSTRDAVQYAQVREVRVFYAISEDGELLLARRSFPEEYREAFEIFVGDVGPRYVTLLGLVTPPPDYVRRCAGFRISEGRDGDGGRLATTAVPFWAIILLFALAGVPAVRSAAGGVRTRTRRRRRRCLSCGYDLRASPERCPECGAAPR